MIEVRRDTIFQKLKTEILPLSQEQFTDFVHEIILRMSEGKDQSIAIRILSDCFSDNIEIQRLINQGFDAEWHSQATETYKKLSKDKQAAFKKSINKKFEPRNEMMKDMEIDKTLYDLIENQVDIKDIIVPERFKETPPSGYKIRKIYDHYKKFGIFPAKVILDETNSLISGYPVILVCKMVDKTDLLCYNMVRKSL